jgi:branched-chain amino acid aminotransferase
LKGAVYVNGTITAADQAVVPVYDHGFVYGEGVYETLRTYNRIPFLYERHMRRLRASAAALHLHVPFDDDALRGWLDDTMAVANRLSERLPKSSPNTNPNTNPNSSDEAYIRILLTRGVGELSYDLKATPAPSLIIIVKPFDEPPARMFDEGIKISLVSVIRNHPGSVNPIIKSNNLLNNAIAMQEAHRTGGEEALMCNYRGELSECSQSNFFLVRDGVALTPRSASGLLEGLTRGFLFEVGRDVDVPVEEATLRPEDLDTAQEAFITGSTRELTPVVRIDDRVIGTGRPGPVTKKLLEGFRKKAWDLSAQEATAR